MLKISNNPSSALQQLELLKLKPLKRRRILRSVGRRARQQSRDRIKQQRGLDGSNWKSRSDGKKKQMLRKLSKYMQVHTTVNNVSLQFSNNHYGQAAKAHQHGITETKTAKQLQQRYGTPNYKAPATRLQAKKLREAGYKIRTENGKGWKRPSIKWIVANLTQGKAGTITKLLTDVKSKKQWQVELPERSFLGQSPDEQKELTNFMLSEAMRLK